MTQDNAMRARVAGKEAVAARTVWEFTVGGLRTRCLRDGAEFIVQGRTHRGWTEHVATGTDPLDLLRRMVGSVGVARAVAERIEET